MGYLLIGAILVLLLMSLGGGRMLKLPTWRIGSAMGALFAFMGAGFFLIRPSAATIPLGLTLAVIGLWLAASSRFPRSSGTKTGARGRPARDPAKSMSADEARAILGVTEDATREEIQAAYHRLMKRVHPDTGGAPGLAAQLNAARDRLLKDR